MAERHLTELLDRLPSGGELQGPDTLVSGVSHDSRRVTPGDLFVAMVGSRADGHGHVDEAAGRGAAAVCVQRAVDVDLPRLVVPDTRRALPWLAAELWNHPSQRLRVVGVTGTNGKTTVTHLLGEAVAGAGGIPGIVGTVGARIGERRMDLTHTTPEADELQRLLAVMVAAGADVVAMEVSSHALALHRADAVRFAVGAFTNLSQDHLDFHGDVDAYLEAKLRLFSAARAAVVCVDDDAGRRVHEEIDLPGLTVSVLAEADVTADDLLLDPGGSSFVAVGPWGRMPVRLPLPGRFNVANALVAHAVAHLLGLPAEAVAAWSTMSPVPGRFETVVTTPLRVVVDYAHTPAAIATVVAAARELTSGRVIVVVGAGGDRDRAKRPAMGAAAAKADLAVITSDNPRSEDPLAIIDAVAAGARSVRGADVVIEADRRAAIAAALAVARPGDVVLVLGKGHETGQQIGGRTLPFDDRLVVLEELEALGAPP